VIGTSDVKLRSLTSGGEGQSRRALFVSLGSAAFTVLADVLTQVF